MTDIALAIAMGCAAWFWQGASHRQNASMSFVAACVFIALAAELLYRGFPWR